MTLEIGKKYITRNNHIVEITSYSGGVICPYIGEIIEDCFAAKLTYTNHGRTLITGYNLFDIVKEFKLEIIFGR